VVLGNLVVYPITSKSQVDAGPLVLLDDALAKEDAEVRETDASGSVGEHTDRGWFRTSEKHRFANPLC